MTCLLLSPGSVSWIKFNLLYYEGEEPRLGVGCCLRRLGVESMRVCQFLLKMFRKLFPDPPEK